MKYPDLIPDAICKTDIHVYIEKEELTEDGAPIISIDKDLKCFYQGSAKKVLDSQKKSIVLSGEAYFNGDIAPDVVEITGGYVILFGEKREINRGFKARNLDGTVNYTRLEII